MAKMANSCKGVCEKHKAEQPKNKMRYVNGQKFCAVCRQYFDQQGSRCPCCSTKLRTKPRTTEGKIRYAIYAGVN